MAAGDAETKIIEKLIESISTANANTLAASQATWNDLLKEQAQIRQLLASSIEVQKEQNRRLEHIFAIPSETVEKVNVLQNQILEVSRETRETMRDIREGFSNGWTAKVTNAVSEVIQEEAQDIRDHTDQAAKMALLKATGVFTGFTAILGFITWLFEKIYHTPHIGG